MSGWATVKFIGNFFKKSVLGKHFTLSSPLSSLFLEGGGGVHSSFHQRNGFHFHLVAAFLWHAASHITRENCHLGGLNIFSHFRA